AILNGPRSGSGVKLKGANTNSDPAAPASGPTGNVPSLCQSRNSGGMNLVAGFAGGYQTHAGVGWSLGFDDYCTFVTILPPNSPSCAGVYPNGIMESASSYHIGGVNALMFDGS